MSDILDYTALKALAEQLGRPSSTLMALAAANDPFAIGPARREAAAWFAAVWRRLKLRNGVHVRRVHYQIISQKRALRLPDGKPYENTMGCWAALCAASRDARYLDLVPADHFVDRRNGEPIQCLSGFSTDASLVVISGGQPRIDMASHPGMPSTPKLFLHPPAFEQPHHIELWCEKTTVNDVLVGLAERYGLNVVTGAGELSLTACIKLIERAEESERPVRILYISDFDPAGQSMPVAVARKIEHRLRLKGLDLDIQVRPVALTLDQCREYRLPRTPIKDTERRKAGFEERHGEGATELDALEALHPGTLRRILQAEIERYHDATLDRRVQEATWRIESEIAEINKHIHEQHRAEVEELEAEWEAINAEHQRQLEQWRERAEPVWQVMAEECEFEAPDIDEIEWPEPEDADEDQDPLFNSTRDYVEQIDKYKRHQGKPIARRGRNGGAP
jgi:hypothetical protein